MEEYHPLFAKWTGSGEHFGFMNQPTAGYANFAMLASSVMPIIERRSSSTEKAKETEDEIMKKAQEMFEEKLMAVFRSKMGFHPADSSPDELWTDLEALLRENRSDWTLFWRQLSYVAKEFPVSGASTSYGDMLELLSGNDEVKEGSSPFYITLDIESRAKMLKWIQRWREALVKAYEVNGSSASLAQNDEGVLLPEERMLASNPKYVLREWMLVEAYSKASPSSNEPTIFGLNRNNNNVNDESMIHELFELIQNPYDEGSDKQDEKYYRRAPDTAAVAGGTAFMS